MAEAQMRLRSSAGKYFSRIQLIILMHEVQNNIVSVKKALYSNYCCAGHKNRIPFECTNKFKKRKVTHGNVVMDVAWVLKQNVVLTVGAVNTIERALIT